MKTVADFARIFYYRLSDFLSDESERLPLWLPVAFAAGIGTYFSLNEEPYFFIVLCCFLLALFLLFDARKSPKYFFAALLLAAYVGGFACAQFRTISVSEPKFKTASKTVSVTGTVLNAETNAYGKNRVVLKNPFVSGYEEWAVPKKVRLTLKKGDPLPEIGEVISLKALLFPPSPPLIDEGYDQAEALYFEKIGATGFARSSYETIAKAPEKTDFASFVFKIRQSINDALSETLPPDISEVAKALTTGTTKAIPTQIADSYRDSGIAHLLSVSGLHMSLIAGAVFGCVRLLLACFPAFALRYSTKKTAAVVALTAAFFYLFISGNALPARRAFIMIAFVFTAVLFDRRALSLVAAAWAAFFILLLRPESLLSASFQLSFAAVVALISAYEAGIDKFRKHIAKKEGIPFFLISCVVALFATDIVAGIATAPYVLYYFGRYPLYSLLGNLASSAVTGFVVMPFLMAGTLLIPFGIERIPYEIAGYGIAFINEAAKRISELPAAVIQTPSMPFWGMLCCTLSGLWLCLWKSKARYYAVPFFILGLFSPSFHLMPDLLVSPGASIIAFKNEKGNLILPPGKSDALARRVWLEKNAQRETDANGCFECFKGSGYHDSVVDFSCQKGLCLLKKGDLTVAWTKGKRAFKRACDDYGEQIAVLFSGIPRHRADCKDFLTVNRTDSLRNGTISAVIKDGTVEIQSIAEKTGFRPWTAPFPMISPKSEILPFFEKSYGFPVKARLQD